jgi:rSAM/selenodomain-associated transferase 1
MHNARRNGSEEALIIFARKPELGNVKTRLAAQIGEAAALTIYEKLLHHTKRVAEQCDCDTYVFLSQVSENDFWKDFLLEVQAEGDLGEKMYAAFHHLFDIGYKRVVIIGSDCPSLRPAHVTEAFAALHERDVVLGPAADGGYYLLGMHRLHHALFHGKEWSTPTIFVETIHSIDGLALTYYLLPMLTDVDEKEDVPLAWREPSWAQ